MDEHSEQSRLSTSQKTGFVLLLVFGLLVVSLAFLQMRNTIYSPFVIRVSEDGQNLRAALEVDETTRLQQIDTDHDGLNDYEELFFYETSPYIPDTDSDGIDDKAELEAGTDPTCPEGQSCSADAYDATSSSTLEVNPLQDSVVLPDELVADAEQDVVGDLTQQFDMTAIATDPTLLRQLLLQTGQISEEQLNMIDDATLLQFASELTTTAPTTNIQTTTTFSIE